MDTDDKMFTRRTLLAGFGVAALGAMAFQRSMLDREPVPQRVPGTGRLPNPTVFTHEGRAVKFYDDLIRDKVVAISMTYAQCTATCPATMGNLIRVQDMLGERIGRDIFMYSITLFPEVDTPRVLKQYAEKFGVKPGWTFLTGAPSDIESLRFALGFYDLDPAVDAIRTQHANMIRIGNAAYDRWTMSPGLVRPELIVSTINHVDRSVVHTAHIPATA
ncbi:MAG: SCO family protein [Thiobacillus sp.]|nr:SCO family protein [Thiobacillus sp.]MDP3124062.1 SCO family protein [Thiobacillus sp.]